MKKILALIFAILCIFVLVACDDNTTDTNDGDGTTKRHETTAGPGEDTTYQDVDDEGEAILKKIESYAPLANMGTIKEKIESFSSLEKYGNTDKASEWTEVTNLDFGTLGYIKINAEGIYHITGTTARGYIEVNVKGKTSDFTTMPEVVIILDNVNITAMPDAASMPPIYSEDCNLTIILAKDSVNTVTDTALNKNNGAIYVKSGTLTMGGEGKLTVNAYAKSGIYNTKSITINGGVYDISANYHGICAKNDVTVNSGDFNILSTKSGIKCGDFDPEVPDEATVGNLAINGGKFIVNAQTNGINAYGTVSIKGAGLNITANEGIDATGNVTLGTDSAIIVESQMEGIKTDGDISISGNVCVKAGDDGIKGNNITVNTLGIVFVSTCGSFAQDNENGTFVRDRSGDYIKVKPEDFKGRYNLYVLTNDCRGIKAQGTFTMTNGYVAVDSVQDAINAESVTASAGTLVLASSQDAISVNQNLSLDNVKLNVMKAYKGIKCVGVTFSGSTVMIASTSDAINGNSVVVNSGTLYLFDCVDVGETGTFTVNSGTLISIADTKNPKIPTSTQDIISGSVENPDGFVYGKHIRVFGDGIESSFIITKNYSDKLSIVITSAIADSGAEYQVQVGTYSGGTPSGYVFTPGGTFTADKTAKIN